MQKIGSTVYYLIGIPASGKSTYAEKLGLPVLSSDNLREELTGNAGDITSVPLSEIFKILAERATNKLESGQDFVYDATNITANFRREKLTAWKNLGAKIKGVLMVAPKEIALQRNATRDRVVPPEVIERMYESLTDNPIETDKDLFDEIIIVDQEGNELSIYSKEMANSSNNEFKISPQQFTPFKK